MSTLEVLRHLPQFRTVALTAHHRFADLAAVAHEFHPKWLVATDETVVQAANWQLPANTALLTGPHGIERVVRDPEVDIVVAAIVGRAGLEGAWHAVDAGKRVALANKETLVMAGHCVMQRAVETGAELLPVDSEHSAIFQAMQAGRREEVERVVLTASGGPFLRRPISELADATAEEALCHPTWEMGPKITIDSATMMNKALEIIEARWLFDLPVDQISVMVHPQSIVHSLVEFRDGSVVAQMSPPDMKLPIQLALTHPERSAGPADRIDWNGKMELQFEPPDLDRFPALELGFQVASDGGTAGAVLNAANEAAVAEFLANRLRFTEIVTACREVLASHDFEPNPTLDRILEVDRWAREEIRRWISA